MGGPVLAGSLAIIHSSCMGNCCFFFNRNELYLIVQYCAQAIANAVTVQHHQRTRL